MMEDSLAASTCLASPLESGHFFAAVAGCLSALTGLTHFAGTYTPPAPGLPTQALGRSLNCLHGTRLDHRTVLGYEQTNLVTIILILHGRLLRLPPPSALRCVRCVMSIMQHAGCRPALTSRSENSLLPEQISPPIRWTRHTCRFGGAFCGGSSSLRAGSA